MPGTMDLVFGLLSPFLPSFFCDIILEIKLEKKGEYHGTKS